MDKDSSTLSGGVALSLSSVIGATAGLLGWVVSTRLVEPAEVGRAAQFVSAFLMVAGATQLNLGVGLLRWIPKAGRSAGRIVWWALLAIMTLAAGGGLAYALALPSIPDSAAGGESFEVGVLLFVAAATGWGAFAVHDFVLLALGRPWWTVWRNALFAIARIGLLVGLAGLGAQGIALSWVGPIVVWILAGSLLLAVLIRRGDRRSQAAALPSRRDVLGFLGPTAVAQLGTVLLYNQVTVLVTARFGPETGAQFFIVWQAATVVDLAATFFLNSLVVAVARHPDRGDVLAAAARRQLLVLFLPVLAVGAAVAGPALDLVFGRAYAAAADVLRLLMLGLAFRLIVLHELGVRQALGRAVAFARLQLASTVLVAGAVVVVPVGHGTVSDLLPVAGSYVAIQAICAAAVLGSSAARRRSAKTTPRALVNQHPLTPLLKAGCR